MKKTYPMIDIVKFICALLVLTLHLVGYAFADLAVDGAPPTGGVLLSLGSSFYYLFARICVPFFFLSSSFFLFKKIKENPNERKEILKKYCIRLAILYLVWQLISLPYMIDKYFFNPLTTTSNNTLFFFLRIITLNGFDGSWYLSALLFGVLIVSLFKNNNKGLLILSICLYIIPCLFSNYNNLFSNLAITNFLKSINNFYSVFLSVLSGLIFISLGKIIAEKEITINRKTNIICLIVFALLSFIELFLTNFFQLSIAADSFFMLVPYSFFLFTLLLSINIEPKKSHVFLRKSSIFIYLLQFPMLYIIYRFVNTFNWTIFKSNIIVVLLLYVFIVLLSMLICKLLIKLQKLKRFDFLKYFY